MTLSYVWSRANRWYPGRRYGSNGKAISRFLKLAIQSCRTLQTDIHLLFHPAFSVQHRVRICLRAPQLSSYLNTKLQAVRGTDMVEQRKQQLCIDSASTPFFSRLPESRLQPPRDGCYVQAG